MEEQDLEYRFAFNFDLDEARLKELYPAQAVSGYKRAWSDIRSFLEANGFTHTQYSGYESIEHITYARAYGVLEKLQSKFSWFSRCAQAAIITEIGERYNVLEHLRGQASETEYILNSSERQASKEQAKVAQVMKAITPGASQAQPGLATAPTRPQPGPQPQSGLGR